jgi:hypothetical protein
MHFKLFCHLIKSLLRCFEFNALGFESQICVLKSFVIGLMVLTMLWIKESRCLKSQMLFEVFGHRIEGPNYALN